MSKYSSPSDAIHAYDVERQERKYEQKEYEYKRALKEEQKRKEEEETNRMVDQRIKERRSLVKWVNPSRVLFDAYKEAIEKDELVNTILDYMSRTREKDVLLDIYNDHNGGIGKVWPDKLKEYDIKKEEIVPDFTESFYYTIKHPRLQGYELVGYRTWTVCYAFILIIPFRTYNIRVRPIPWYRKFFE